MPVFKIGKNCHTVIEIGRSCLKVLQAEVSKQGIIISKVIGRSIAGLADDEISKVLAEVIDANNIKMDRLTAIISRNRVMVRYVRLPATKREEIDSMVSFEAARQIPYSPEEIVSDYEIIDTDSEGYAEIMLAIVHKNELAKINNILTPVKKRPDQIKLSSEAILGWLKNAAKEELSQKSICLLDIDTDSTEILIISNGRMEFSRVASIGAADISLSAPEAVISKRRLIDEIRRSISMYEKERAREASAISEFLITGANSVIEDISAFIKEQMDTPCRSINILSTLPLADGTLPDGGILPDGSLGAACGGIFLTGGVNLIPAEQKEKQEVKAKVQKLAKVSASVMAGLILLSAVALIRLYQKERMLIRLENMLQQIEPQIQATEDKLKKLRVIKQQVSEGATSLDVIFHLYRLIPASISLVDFDYEDKKRIVSFRGTAARMSDVFNLATILEESEKFGNVQTRSASKRQTRQGEMVDFQIHCSFIARDGS